MMKKLSEKLENLVSAGTGDGTEVCTCKNCGKRYLLPSQYSNLTGGCSNLNSLLIDSRVEEDYCPSCFYLIYGRPSEALGGISALMNTIYDAELNHWK